MNILRKQKYKINKDKFNLFFACALFVLSMFFTYTVPLVIHADNGTVICSAQANPGSNVGTCINRIYVISLAIGGTIAVLTIVLAGYLYLQGGDSVKTGKTMLISAITGLVILFSTYIFLNTINPDLTTFSGGTLQDLSCTGAGANAGQNLCTLPSVTAPTTAGGTPTNPNNLPNALAQKLLSENGNVISFQSGTDCSGNGPIQNITQAANGQPITIDGPGSTCGAGTIQSLNATMLQALQTLQQDGHAFAVTSIASGHHASAADPHYSGNAVDIVPSDKSVSNEMSNFVDVLSANGAVQIAAECNPSSGGHIYEIIPDGGPDPSGCQNESGYHIHAQWGS